MMPRESFLEMAQRHVLQGAKHILRQREIIGLLRARGQSTAMSEDLLATFEDTQILHCRHLDELRREPSASRH